MTLTHDPLRTDLEDVLVGRVTEASSEEEVVPVLPSSLSSCNEVVVYTAAGLSEVDSMSTSGAGLTNGVSIQRSRPER